jgi:hypothetical protein
VAVVRSKIVSPTWSDVRAALLDFDRAGLRGLVQGLYTASKDNQTFLHAWLGLGHDQLQPFKASISKWVASSATCCSADRFGLIIFPSLSAHGISISAEKSYKLNSVAPPATILNDVPTFSVGGAFLNLHCLFAYNAARETYQRAFIVVQMISPRHFVQASFPLRLQPRLLRLPFGVHGAPSERSRVQFGRVRIASQRGTNERPRLARGDQAEQPLVLF